MIVDKITKRIVVTLTAATVLYVAIWMFHARIQVIAVFYWLVVALAVAALFRLRRSPVVVGVAIALAAAPLALTAPAVLAWTAWGMQGFAP
jgi:hypothetical protein